MGWARPRAYFKSQWKAEVILCDMEVAGTTGGRGTYRRNDFRCTGSAARDYSHDFIT